MSDIIPHPDNSCGGNYSDWLDVMLLPECNGHCSWCIEKDGYHPEERANVDTLLDKVKLIGRKNIVLLGGEPFLYPNLLRLVKRLHGDGFNVYITTNGSYITHPIFEEVAPYLTGINFSIHHHDLPRNRVITGITINQYTLFTKIQYLKKFGVKVRFNCNLIRGQIDTGVAFNTYVIFSKMMYADSVKFSELSNVEPEDFVSMNVIGIPGLDINLSADPFIHGCSNKSFIHMEQMIHLKQSCGIIQHGIGRSDHNGVECVLKPVLYYDGYIYSGWKSKNWNGENIDSLYEAKDVTVYMTKSKFEEISKLMPVVAENSCRRSTPCKQTYQYTGCHSSGCGRD